MSDLLQKCKHSPQPMTPGQAVTGYTGLYECPWCRAEAAESKVDALMREKEEQIERCAKVCDDYAALQNEAWVQPGHAIRSCAWAIRALVREQHTHKEDLSDSTDQMNWGD